MKISSLPMVSCILLAVLLSSNLVFAAERGASTPEERARAVKLAHDFETSPLTPQDKADRTWFATWLIEVPDISVPVLYSLLGPVANDHQPYALEICTQLMFSGAAFVIENPDKASDEEAIYLAQLQGALRAYESILASVPEARRPFLDELLAKQAHGTLSAYVKEVTSSPTTSEVDAVEQPQRETNPDEAIGPEQYIKQYMKLGLDIKIPITDELNWFLAYHRKYPQPEAIPSHIKSLVEKKYFEAKPEAVAELTHFLSAALVGKETVLLEMENIAATASSKDKESLERVIAEARAFKSPQADSAENMRLLWAEFRADGKKDSLMKIIDVLRQPASIENRELIEEAMLSLFFGKILWGDDGIINAEAENATADLKDRLETLQDKINKLSKLSSIHNEQGRNHRKLNNYQEASKAFEKAISIYPYFPVAYSNLGVVHEDKDDSNGAFFYMLMASRLDNSSAFVQHSMGRQYAIRKRWVESIPCFRIAVEREPRNPTYLNSLGRSYWNIGEKDKAVPYFKRYLEHDPNGKFADSIRNCLKGANIIVDPPPPDKLILLQSGSWSVLEADFQKLLSGRQKNESGRSKLGDYYKDFCRKPSSMKSSEDWINLLRSWAEKSKTPHYAYACLGSSLIDYAWEMRGSSWSATVVPKGKDLFNKYLEEARQVLELAWKTDTSDPFPPTRLITVATGLGLDRDEMEKQFQRALAADNTDIEPYATKLLYLMPKWHGSREEMFDFARKTAAGAPKGTLIPTVLAKAHWEMYFRALDDGKKYFDAQEPWREVKEVYEKVLADYPNAILTHNFLAKAAFLAHDYQTARFELEIIGDDWAEDVWGNSSYFLNSREKVFDKTSAIPQ